MPEPYATVLRGQGIGPQAAGGKGAALDRLVALGVMVPPTGVITTAAYRAFAETDEIARFVNELRRKPIPDPSKHDDAKKRVDEVFLSVDMPSSVAEVVARVAPEVSGDGLMAVRSSATAEDLKTASFAGQYESYLNVDVPGLADAVRLVWSSLWYPAPREYRRFRQITEDDLTMAVVVMRMLDPTEAGVLFTIDPAGSADFMRLEVVQGLGEQLVSGEKTPDAYVVPRTEAASRFAAISPPLGELASEGLRLEEAFDVPQDIEFAVHDGVLYLVQARPVTTTAAAAPDGDGFDHSCGDDVTYTTAGIAEMLPGVLGPLSWTVNSWLVENGFRYLFELLGGGADVLTQEHALIARFGGRAALNLDAMRTAAASVPGGSADELEARYFGEPLPRTADEQPPSTPLSRGASARQGVKVLRARREAAEQSEVAIQAVNELLDHEPDLTDHSDAELLAYWNRLLHLSQTVVSAEIAVAAMAAAAYRGVETFLGRYLDEAEAAVAAQRLTEKGSHQRRSRIALALETVIDRIQADEALAEAATEEWEQAEAALGALPGGSDLLDQFHHLLRRAGSTGVFAGPTWDEVPHLAWMTVYQELTKPSSRDAAQTRRAAREEIESAITAPSRWRWSRIVTGQILDVRRRFLRREAVDAAEFLQRRERAKAAVLILGGVVRRTHQEIARRLVNAGGLESVDEIEMLSVAEIPLALDGAGPTPEIIAGRQRRHQESLQAEPLPAVWEGVPTHEQSAPADGECFEGWCASPGHYEGLAHVVQSVTSGKIPRGAVLVANTTDASWAPLFMTAGAIVVEQGGPLSHAAIVARELGMPAVVNVPGLIARLENEPGPVPVVIDGTGGSVTILSGAGENGGSADAASAPDQTAPAEPAPSGDAS